MARKILRTKRLEFSLIMSRIIKLFIIIGLLFAAVLFSLQLFQNKAGDIKPAVIKSDNKQNISRENNEVILSSEEGENIRLKIPPEYNIEVYASLAASPRDLEFAGKGLILVSLPSKGQVMALIDKSIDSQPPQSKILLTNLDNPHGIAVFDKYLLVAQESRVDRYFFDRSSLEAQFDKKLFDLPKGGRHHTRSLTINQEGILYVSIGSACDVCAEKNPFLASVVKSDIDGRNPQVFAKGLRNSVFIKLNPATSELWGTEMGRDFLGDNLPPDEINVIRENSDYGWPYCYGTRIRDSKFEKNNLFNCNDTVPPLYQIPAHSAPLGLNFITSDKFSQDWLGDLLVSYHGSWNSSVPVGYKIVRLEVQDGRITSESDFIFGWLTDSSVSGRPVDLEFDDQGNLFISDDKAGVIYRMWRQD